MSTEIDRADRTLASGLSERSARVPHMADVSRGLFRSIMAQRCNCGAAPLLPGDHAESCPYRTFWYENVRSIDRGDYLGT